MANLLSQNIGTNYKSILNLDATTINTPLDATLRAVTDGMGTASLLNLSTEQVGVLRTVNLSAGATTPRLFNVAYTINNSGAQTGTLTGLFLNATETALNGMTHNLFDLQVGGVSKLKVSNIGITTALTFLGTSQVLTSAGSGSIGVQSVWYMEGNTSGIACIKDWAGTSFNRLQLGGTTASFPAIKRNGAALDFRLADDSAACNINSSGLSVLSAASVGVLQVSNVTTYGFHMSRNFVVSWGSNTQLDGSLDTAIARYSANVVRISNASTGAGNLFVGASTGYNASAVLQADSTNQGFLPPRMTQAQKNAIATPAAGLMVYDTTLAKLCVYTTAWETVTSL